jgi:hypothetical protein
LKEEALDRTLWRTCFGKGYGPVVRQTTEWMKVYLEEIKSLSLMIQIKRVHAQRDRFVSPVEIVFIV